MKHALFALTLLLIGAVQTAAGPAEDAARAADALRAAQTELARAQGKANRVRALTEAITAVEQGMAAMRIGLRQAAIRERALQQRLTRQEVEISRLLSALQMINRAPEPAFILHPMGPIGTARSGMILSEVTPALTAKARALRIDIQEAAFLVQLQTAAQDTLHTALADLQKARVDLSDAISERTDIPRRFIDDPAQTALLVATTDTLDAFAEGLGNIVANDFDVTLPDPFTSKGTLPPPAFGQILRKFGERDAAGVARPGVIMATEPGALVRTPLSATVRYQGPLLDYGQVIILEPAVGTLFVFAGLGKIFAKIGEVVIEGAPIGLMPEGAGAGQTDQNTLYIEIREDKTPVDPSQWVQF